MKKMVLGLSTVLVASTVFAQGALPTRKTVVRYDEATNSVVEAPAEVQSVSPQPIYILNNQQQRNAQTAVQDQPLTVVEASPLKESRAEQLRRARQNAETQTEMKIVEKLEEARMEEERARAERLFGNGFNSGVVTQPTAPQAVVPAPQPIAPVHPVVVEHPAVIVEKEEEDKVDIREEIRAALADHQPKQEDKQKFYVSAMVGTAEYPDVRNVRGNVATGVALGIVTPERIVGEGSFMYSDYRIQVVDGFLATPYPLFKDMKQYNVAAAIKYMILPGRFSPFLGALGSYTNRSYSDRQSVAIASNSVSTQAFDVGMTAGADLSLTENFLLGIDFRYYTNISYRQDSDFQAAFIGPRVGTPIEELDYYTATLSGKFVF